MTHRLSDFLFLFIVMVVKGVEVFGFGHPRTKVKMYSLYDSWVMVGNIEALI